MDTCEYYYNIIYSWRNSYDLQYYDRLQVQYRFASEGDDYHAIDEIPDSEWHNIGGNILKDVIRE